MKRYIQPLPTGGNLPSREWFFNGFNLGNDTYSLPTEIKPNAYVQGLNVELYGKRSVRPRRGGEKLGNDIGTGERVDGLYQYKEGVVNSLIAYSAGVFKKYNTATEDWDAISASGSYTSGLRTRGVKMRSSLYLGNGVDPFSKYDGSSIAQFTAVAAPTGLTVVPQGTTGTTEYAYQVNAVTAKGDSIPCTLVIISNGNETLTSVNKNRITFNRRTETQVIGYNLFGRKLTGNGVTLLKYIDQPTSGSTITWDDDGSVTPQIWLPPDGDSTDGPSLPIWEQLRGSLVGAGDPNARDRLYFSGTGDKFESFSPAHNGGWVDIRPGDNDSGLTGIVPFESFVVVTKQNSIHKFFFSQTDGEATLQELITYVGCGAPGSLVAMDNDLGLIDIQGKFRIIGYEPNYGSNIRTTSLSEGRAQSLYDEIDPTYLTNCEAVYDNSRYILACTSRGSTQNDFVIIYDRRYLSFLGKWTGPDCNVRCWVQWDGVDKKRRLYAGSSTSDAVFEFNVEGKLTNWDGTAVESIIRLRNEDMGNSGQQKLWKWADFRLYRFTGNISLKTIVNGQTTLDTKQYTATTSSGWGTVRWGTKKWGVSTGTPYTASNLDVTKRKELYEISNSIQFELSKNDSTTDFVLVSARGEAGLLPEEVFDSSNLI